MAPLTKDSLEVSTSVGEPAVSGGAGQPKQASGQLRSDALSLEIPVKVHGSRVTQVVREVTSHTEPFEEQTSTMIVFPQGAVLRMTTAVTVGQMLVVTNSKTRQDAICRVVKVRTFSNAQGYVEIEFSHPQPGYWSVNFSGDAAASAKKPAAAPSPIQREEPKVEPVAEISWAPARVAAPPVSNPVSTMAPVKPQSVPSIPPPAPPVRPNAPESSFILIGSQEETQVAASSTSRSLSAPSSSPRVETGREARAPEPPKRSAVIDFPAAPPSTPVPSLSMAELLGDELASPVQPHVASTEREATWEEEKVAALIESSVKISQSSFGSLSGGASLPVDQSQPMEPFTSSLDSVIAELTAAPPAPRQSSGFLVAAAIFVVFACVVGGGFYFRQELGFQKSDRANSRPASNAASQTGSSDANRSAPVQQPASALGNQPASGTIPKPTVTVPGTTITVSANATPDNTSPSPAASQPPVTAKPKGPSVTSDMLASTLNAHPTSASHADTSQADAPSIDTAAGASNPDAALPDLSSSGNVASPPPPAVVPENPIKVGGEVKEPRLLVIKQPLYPTVAKEAHIQGDVVISTQIDKSGNVVHMQVLSGPTMLRQPALQALRQWKYSPTTLNGQPVSIEMQVTVKFRM